MKKSAFTLIELLVVISIIAILAGIALPVFSSVQEKGKAIKDANNLHQMGIEFVAFTNDNNDSIFTILVPPVAWPQQLNPKYGTDWTIFKSPFDARPLNTGVAVGNNPVSYGVNNSLFNGNTPLKSMSDVVSPSSCILIAPLIANENIYPAANAFNATAAANSFVLKTINGAGSTGGTHSGSGSSKKRINALFADSHVADMTMSDFHSIPPLANPDNTSTIKDLRWNN